jgi:hypothetical protein
MGYVDRHQGAQFASFVMKQTEREGDRETGVEGLPRYMDVQIIHKVCTTISISAQGVYYHLHMSSSRTTGTMPWLALTGVPLGSMIDTYALALLTKGVAGDGAESEDDVLQISFVVGSFCKPPSG